MSASDTDADDVFEPAESDYQKHLSDALGVTAGAKILTFSEKAPEPKEGQLRFPAMWLLISRLVLGRRIQVCQSSHL